MRPIALEPPVKSWVLKAAVARRPIRIDGPCSESSPSASSSCASIAVPSGLTGRGFPKGCLPKSEKEGIGAEATEPVAVAVFGAVPRGEFALSATAGARSEFFPNPPVKDSIDLL